MAQDYAQDRDDLRYVLSGTPMGWSALEKKVRQVDEDRVQDSKEDIDTLLVFAGLFSAVMTAFLIESYKTLQPDPQHTMVQLLREIANQTRGYTVTSNLNPTVLNSTAVSPSFMQTFEAPQIDIRVNVLWFASLIFSLVTASLGILVKQWLREYLAIERTVPQERLRIRHFRYPALEEWKVFEIVAFLPVLLQLALGLFLLGLCFFAWSVHPSIGKTSTPLVCGWAFVFLLTTIAPAFSPRCPYKTTFLKTALKYIRPSIRPVVPLFRRLAKSTAASVSNAVTISISPMKVVITKAVTFTISSAKMAIAKVHSFFSSEESPPQAQPVGNTETASLNSSVRSSISRLMIFVGDIVAHDNGKVEEDTAAASAHLDVTILDAVDAVLVDDYILGTAMREALREWQVDGDQLLSFVQNVLERRITLALDSIFPKDDVQPLPQDLTALTQRAWRSITDIVADALRSHPDIHTGHWHKRALMILMSRSNHELSKDAVSAIAYLLQHEEKRHYICAGLEITSSVSGKSHRGESQEGEAQEDDAEERKSLERKSYEDNMNFQTVVENMEVVLTQLDGSVVVSVLSLILESRIKKKRRDRSNMKLFVMPQEATITPKTLPILFRIVASVLSRTLKNTRDTELTFEHEWMSTALRFCISAMIEIKRHAVHYNISPSEYNPLQQSLSDILHRTLISGPLISMWAEAIANQMGSLTVAPMRNTITISLDQSRRSHDWAHVREKFADHLKSKAVSEEDSLPIAYVLRLSVLSTLLHDNDSETDMALCEQSTRILSHAIQHNPFYSTANLTEEARSEGRLLAQDCLSAMQKFDRVSLGPTGRSTGDDKAYAQWKDQYDPKHPHFDNDFVRTMIVIAGREGCKYPTSKNLFWRVRRLEELSPSVVRVHAHGEGTEKSQGHNLSVPPIPDQYRTQSEYKQDLHSSPPHSSS